MKEGSKVLVFDSTRWNKTGDVGDNSQFYKAAIVIRVYYHIPILYGSSDWVADILWLHNRQVSKGHFISGLKIIK